ncbi:RAS protein activator like-3-like isoform X1 [Acipenser oxyrinchus oxyrinchus]|uniref:RAS protein activator like-3-like isoform X1 n=1 Tax=Acipenser oxyrinchus oxyrinchus TaxID=40147 RepID=A0AAD8CN18_ACIOX|nr:RAS protein activator like-3-like isoform X1 [Acipenser oxyrinchus oxyrinchus]
MGIGTELEIEIEPQEPQQPGSSLPEETPPAPSCSTDDNTLLKTYKWHTGTKPGIEGLKAEGASGEKGGTKWGRMQNWRKALSEDSGSDSAAKRSKDSSATAPPSKAEDPAGGHEKPPRKSPFRRALSEPPGSMMAVMSPSKEQQRSPEGQSPSEGPQQKGALFRKYLRSVSQRFRKPRAQNKPEATASMDTSTDEPAVAPLPLRLSWAPPQEVPVWDISSCNLLDGRMVISREDEPVYRIRNRVSSCLSHLNLAGSRCNLEGPTENAPPLGQKSKGQSEGGVKGMIIRRFKQGPLARSSSHLNDVNGSLDSVRPASVLGSRESLTMPVSMAESLDLSNDKNIVIRPLHSSILGEKYCFEVINAEGSRCFGCTSAAERDRWIENLRRAAQPNKDNCERTENMLSFWVNDAKDLAPKKRYFWELHLDGSLYARTTSKTNTMGTLFWGELFELDNLPPVSQLTLYLFRDEESKKKSKEDNCPLGSVSISLPELTGRQFMERWYPVAGHSGKERNREGGAVVASIRIKARYQNVKVLPIEQYKEFAEYITFNYMELCTGLEPIISVKEKEELTCALVHVLQSIGKAKDFLKDLGIAEVDRFGEKESLIFRENTLVTKAIDEYMKLVGQKYLIDTLGDFIAGLYQSSVSCEVDPQKCSPSELQEQQQNLRSGCEEAFQRITETYSSFPGELNEIFSCWQEECSIREKRDIGTRLICASLFLRFLCPAIMSPSLFGLTQQYPPDGTARTLTLTAKVIQNLANFTPFGDKEEYMLFMNEFLEQHWDRMRAFLQDVSNPDSEVHMSRFDGYVDLPLQLSILHELLCAIIAPIDQPAIDKLHPLPSILNRITDSLGSSAPRISIGSMIVEQSKPVYVPPKDLVKYSPVNNSMQQIYCEDKYRALGKERRAVQRTQSVPARNKTHKGLPARQASTEELPPYPETPQLDISYPASRQDHQTQDQAGMKQLSKTVPWINPPPESLVDKKENEGLHPLEKHDQELSELRRDLDSAADREMELAKRLEDFIAQSQDQHALLQSQVQELRGQLEARDEQLASATFRLGVIEEERGEDLDKLSAAAAALERMNMLEQQYANLVYVINQLKEAQASNQTSNHVAPSNPEKEPVENGDAETKGP